MFKFLTCIIALIINNKLNHVHSDDKECTGSYCVHNYYKNTQISIYKYYTEKK